MRRHWGFWIAALAFCALCVAAACIYGTPRREARAAASEPFANAGDYDMDEGAAGDPVLGDPVNRNGRGVVARSRRGSSRRQSVRAA